MNLSGLIGIPEAAKRAKVPYGTMRDRLKRLHKSLVSEGEPGFLVRFGSTGPWKIDPDALKASLGQGREAHQDGLDALASRLKLLESRLKALKNSHAAEKRRQAKRWEIQARVNRRSDEQHRDLEELAST